MVTIAAGPTLSIISLVKKLIPTAIPIRPNTNDRTARPLPIKINGKSKLFVIPTNIKHPTAKGEIIQTMIINARVARNFEHEYPAQSLPIFIQPSGWQYRHRPYLSDSVESLVVPLEATERTYRCMMMLRHWICLLIWIRASATRLYMRVPRSKSFLVFPIGFFKRFSRKPSFDRAEGYSHQNIMLDYESLNWALCIELTRLFLWLAATIVYQRKPIDRT